MSHPIARPALVAALVGAALVAGAGPARAQFVPRLASYPVVQVTACRADAQSSIASKRSVWTADGMQNEKIDVYSDARCAPDALLFSVRVEGDARVVTPTALGTAFLGSRCGEIEWKAGTPRSLTASDCSVVAAVR